MTFKENRRDREPGGAYGASCRRAETNDYWLWPQYTSDLIQLEEATKESKKMYGEGILDESVLYIYYDRERTNHLFIRQHLQVSGGIEKRIKIQPFTDGEITLPR